MGHSSKRAAPGAADGGFIGAFGEGLKLAVLVLVRELTGADGVKAQLDTNVRIEMLTQKGPHRLYAAFNEHDLLHWTRKVTQEAMIKIEYGRDVTRSGDFSVNITGDPSVVHVPDVSSWVFKRDTARDIHVDGVGTLRPRFAADGTAATDNGGAIFSNNFLIDGSNDAFRTSFNLIDVLPQRDRSSIERGVLLASLSNLWSAAVVQSATACSSFLDILSSDEACDERDHLKLETDAAHLAVARCWADRVTAGLAAGAQRPVPVARKSGQLAKDLAILHSLDLPPFVCPTKQVEALLRHPVAARVLSPVRFPLALLREHEAALWAAHAQLSSQLATVRDAVLQQAQLTFNANVAALPHRLNIRSLAASACEDELWRVAYAPDADDAGAWIVKQRMLTARGVHELHPCPFDAAGAAADDGDDDVCVHCSTTYIISVLADAVEAKEHPAGNERVRFRRHVQQPLITFSRSFAVPVAAAAATAAAVEPSSDDDNADTGGEGYDWGESGAGGDDSDDGSDDDKPLTAFLAEPEGGAVSDVDVDECAEADVEVEVSAAPAAAAVEEPVADALAAAFAHFGDTLVYVGVDAARTTITLGVRNPGADEDTIVYTRYEAVAINAADGVEAPPPPVCDDVYFAFGVARRPDGGGIAFL
jgi:hypothetical protein